LHIVGKDIFPRFHATLWPAMLMGVGLPLPESVIAHGYWTIGGEKISKSKHSGKGFRINPLDLAQELVEASGADSDVAIDALRYFLFREMPFGADGDFSLEAVFRRYNSDLANDLGNLLNRTVTMIGKYCDGVIPEVQVAELPEALHAVKQVENYLGARTVNYLEALKAVWELLSYLNRHIEEAAPWRLYKDGKQAEVDALMYTLAEGLRQSAVLLYPFMPTVAEQIARQIGWEHAEWKWSSLAWGGLTAGSRVQPEGPIFPRIVEKEKDGVKEKAVEETPIVAAAPPEPQPTETVTPEIPLITIDEFARVQLKVGTILTAEKHPKADKLVKLQVDLGEAEPRQIIAGIAAFYPPDTLVGRQIIVVANLHPAKLRGEISQGMLLAADTGENGMAVLMPDKAVPNGNKVK